MSMSMSMIADRIRSLRLDKYIDIMFIGDHAKSFLLPKWGRMTDLPDVYQSRYVCSGDTVVCNLWDLPSNTDATKRMFHLDGTEDSGFDYCIIVYDTITRLRRGHILKYLAIRENIQKHQHPNKKCELVVVILKTMDTWENSYTHIVDYCRNHEIHCILMNNTGKDGIDKFYNLPEQLCNLVYQNRKTQMSAKVDLILKESESLKKG
jgi:hypothetical protein